MANSTSLPVYSLPGFYEPFSVFSHLLGAVLFLMLGRRLLRRAAGHPLWQWSLLVYIGSCVVLFATSGTYHMLSAETRARAIMARLDHDAIFVLIAGTFTPVHSILFRGWGRWLPLVLIWLAAFAGIALKTLYFEEMAGWPGLSLYLFLGWLGALSGISIASQCGFPFVKPLLYGGIAYSVGAVLEYFRWPVVVPGVVRPHELFHMAVLMGALFHFSFIWRIALLPANDTMRVAAELYGSNRLTPDA
jgi:channel protein (hemolysin III family)